MQVGFLAMQVCWIKEHSMKKVLMLEAEEDDNGGEDEASDSVQVSLHIIFSSPLPVLIFSFVDMFSTGPSGVIQE